MKLPFGTTLNTVKPLCKGIAVEMVNTTATADAVWVQIPTPTKTVSDGCKRIIKIIQF